MNDPTLFGMLQWLSGWSQNLLKQLVQQLIAIWDLMCLGGMPSKLFLIAIHVASLLYICERFSSRLELDHAINFAEVIPNFWTSHERVLPRNAQIRIILVANPNLAEVIWLQRWYHVIEFIWFGPVHAFKIYGTTRQWQCKILIPLTDTY